jgi:hypothetical protein
MSKLTLICVAVGGIGLICAGSYFGLLFLSGEHLLTAPVFSTDEVQSSRAALAARLDPDRYTPVRVDLSPEMNPISVYLLFGIARGGVSSDVAAYRVEVQTLDGTSVASGEVRAKRGNPHTAAGRRTHRSAAKTSLVQAMTFAVSEAGPHIIRVCPAQRQGLHVTDLRLRLRRNVTIPSVGLLLGGAAALFLAILGGLCGVLRQAWRSRRAPASYSERTNA